MKNIKTKKEVVKTNEPLSYEQQKKLIEEHNRLAVLNYNKRNKK